MCPPIVNVFVVIKSFHTQQKMNNLHNVNWPPFYLAYSNHKQSRLCVPVCATELMRHALIMPGKIGRNVNAWPTLSPPGLII